MDPHRRTLLISGVSLILLAVLYLGLELRASIKPSEPMVTKPDPLASLKARYQRPEVIPYPESNPYSEDKYQLGKLLFFDPRLSRSGVTSCATCHNPAMTWGDGMARAVGHGHKLLPRKTPTLLNLAWGENFFWDGRAATLEEQSLMPIQSETEMNLTLAELMQRLSSIEEYRTRFEKAFPGELMSSQTVAKAIATFERSIVSDIAPFDSWIAGDDDAISESAKRGFVLFNGKGTCVRCHTGWNFTNGVFADIGLKTEDLGRGKILNDKDVHYAFKAPTLRNITRRGPYMHDGSLPTLRAVIENYEVGGTIRRYTAQLHLKPLKLSKQDKLDLIAFLETLTSEDEVIMAPQLPKPDGEEIWRTLSSMR